MSAIKRFFNRIKYRKLRVDILTVFLFLITCSTIAVVWFTYSRHAQAILGLSKRTIEQVTTAIIEKTECLISDVKQLPEVTGWLLEHQHDIAIDNKNISSFMLNAIKFFPNLFGLYIGWPDGEFIAAFKLADKLSNYFDLPNGLPPGTDFGLLVLDRSVSPPTEMWTFKDKNLKTISTEPAPVGGYDPRLRPWYQEAAKSRKLHWTDVYDYPTGDKGITISKAAYSADGQLVAVLGADLPLAHLALYLSQQKIGKTGKAFILDSSGKIVVPKIDTNPETNGGITEKLVSIAFKFHSDSDDSAHDFIFTDNNIQYVASVHHFLISSENAWYIMVIDPLSDFVSGLIKTQHQVVLISLGILLFASLLVVLSSKRISNPIVILAKETDKITHLDLESEIRVKSNIKEIRLLDTSIVSMRRAIRSFARYIPKEVVKLLIDQKQDIVIGGEKKEITIFFSDISGFTSLAESFPTEVIMPLLGEYFDVLSKIILDYEGTIDKYIGDSVMAFWGAPEAIPNHAWKACIGALHCQISISKLNQRLKAEGKPEFLTRIGINTGTAIVGNIGTSERMNYTVIGDPVNIASRLQVINKIYHTRIIVSEEVISKIGDQFLVRPLDIVEVKGRKEKIKIYELLAILKGDAAILAKPEEIDLCTAFTKAYNTFQDGNFKQAEDLFQALHKKYPADFATQTYLDRLGANH